MGLARPGVQSGDPVAQPAGGLLECGEQRAGDAAAAGLRDDVHPLDLAGSVGKSLKASPAHRLTVAVAHQEHPVRRAEFRRPRLRHPGGGQVQPVVQRAHLLDHGRHQGGGVAGIRRGTPKLQLTTHLTTCTDPATPTQPRPCRRGALATTHYDAAMSTYRRIFAMLATLLAATLLISGCSKKSSEPLPDAAGLLTQSIASTKKLQSAHLEIVVNGKIDGLMVKSLSGDLTNVPAVAVKGNSTISMGGSAVDIELVVLDGTLYAALTPNSWLDMGPAAEIYDPSVILNPDEGLANMLTNLTDATAAGFETIGGVPTVKITGKIGADAVNKLIPPLNASAPLPSTVWIEQNAPNQLVQAQVDQSEGNNVQLTLSEWDKPVTVTKPAV